MVKLSLIVPFLEEWSMLELIFLKEHLGTLHCLIDALDLLLNDFERR